MKRELFLLLWITLLGIGSMNAQDQWVTFTKATPEEPAVLLLQSNTNAVIFNVQTPGMYSREKMHNGTEYQRLQLPRQMQLTEEGEPELPYIKQLIAIPECDDITLITQMNAPLHLDNFMVYPAPTYEYVENPDGSGYKQEIFTKNDSIYSLDTYLPAVNAEIVEVGYIRGQRIAEVIIYPIQFNPVEARLQVYTDIEITLAFSGATGAVSANNGIFSNLTQNVTLNYTEGGIGASINDRSSSTGSVSWVEVTDTSGDIEADYLIVSAPKFWNEQNDDLYALAQHRASYNGFDVAIVNVDDVYANYLDMANDPFEEEYAIRDFLKSVFDNGTAHNTYDGKLGYVLLVGGDRPNVSDEYKLPSWRRLYSSSVGYAPADYYYSCLTTYSSGNFDPFGDIFIGRFSLDSEIKLQNIISKTLYFETEYQTDNWRQNVTLAAGGSNAGGNEAITDYNPNIDDIQTLIPPNYEVSKYKRTEMELVEYQQALIANFNGGRLLTQYRGHGGWNSWASPGTLFGPNQFSHLNNYTKQGFVFGIACQNGWLDREEGYCMAEYFTTSETGSVMFLGGSRNTGRSPNNDFGIIMHESIWQNLSHINGEFVLEGQLQIGNSRWYINFGDPATNIMAQGYQITEDLTLSGNINISTDITITNNATVTLNDGAHIHFDVNGKFIVDEGSSLVVGENVVFTGQTNESSISIAGNLSLAGECTSDVRIIVKNGSMLSLNSNNTLRMGENAGIHINSGGLLEVAGGTLTAAQNTWPGIRVNGNSLLPQTFQNQGALILNNGAVIENALTAVQVGSQLFSFPGNQGGIIQANNAQFINNQRDIEFNSYQNTNSQGQAIDNVSHFHHCHFTTDDNTLFSTHHENVKLSGVQGIGFNHTSFSDTRTRIDEIYRRTGIMGINAAFMVYNTNFDQLQYGIYATSSNPNRFFQVYNSDFSTYRGIYFNGMDNATILNNNFFVIPYTQVRCNDSYGIYLEHSTGFRIENNAFESSPEIDCNRQIGIINHNTGSHYNELYRNNFSGLTIGIEAIGSNRGFKPEEGLEIRCNQFENNNYDIFVTPLGLPSGRLEGIRELQGYKENSNHLTTSPAGNLFGNNSPVLISNFINDAERLFYFHHVADEETRLIPSDYSQNIFLQETGHKFDYENSCPDRAMQPKTFNLLITEKQDAQTHYEETSVLLQTYVDDGNTQLMTQQVEMAGEGDAYYTYQYLMQTSPYLSEEVLTSLGAKEEGFNNAMIRDVMVENPQAAKSEEVTLALDSRIDQLPAYMRWQINNGLFQFSEKEIMEHFMAYQKTRHDQALNEIIRGIVHEHEGFENAPSLDQLLAQVDDVRYQYLRAELKFAEGDYAAGLQQLNQVAQQYDLSDENDLLAHQEKTDFYNLLAQWSNHEDHPGFTNLPAEVLLQLESYLEATPRVAGKALSLLMLNDAIAYEEPILYPQEDMLPKTDPVSGPDEFMVPDMDSELRFALYPNPSRDYLTLDWCIESPRLAESGKIEFRNATGVLVHTMATDIPCNQQILPLDGWKSGTYTATLTLNNQLRKTITFVVAK